MSRPVTIGVYKLPVVVIECTIRNSHQSFSMIFTTNQTLTLIVLGILSIFSNLSDCDKMNCCKNLEDYGNLSAANPNCWYNPDIDATPEEIAERNGCIFEMHEVETDDNYVLTMFRIYSNNSIGSTKPPIFLHHGLAGSAMIFMTFGDRSLAFNLAKLGYDVWMANHRGNPYSSGHKYMKVTNPKFWDFSFHEIGTYDLPASLEYISEKTGNFSKIIYIGHSMGTTVSFIYASTRKDHANKYLKAIIPIAPVAGLKYSKLPYNGFMGILKPVADQLRQSGSIVLFPFTKQLKDVLGKYCSHYPSIEVCTTVVQVTQGPSNGELMASDIPTIVAYTPARTPLKNLEHYMQFLLNSNKFQQFDYGAEKNLKVYNSSTPPKYNLTEIDIPVHIFYGRNDIFSPEPAAYYIFNKISSKSKSIKVVSMKKKIEYNHLDFITGKNSLNLFQKPLYRLLKRFG